MEPSRIYAMHKGYWLLPVAVTIITLGIFIYPTDSYSRLLWGLLCPGFWLMMVTSPQRIELTPEGQVHLDGVLRQTRLNLTDITTVENHGRQLVIRHTGGKITVPNWLHHFEELSLDLQQRNPAIKLKDGPLVRLGQSPLLVFLLAVGIALLTVAVTFLFLSAPALRQLL